MSEAGAQTTTSLVPAPSRPRQDRDPVRAPVAQGRRHDMRPESSSGAGDENGSGHLVLQKNRAPARCKPVREEEDPGAGSQALLAAQRLQEEKRVGRQRVPE